MLVALYDGGLQFFGRRSGPRSPPASAGGFCELLHVPERAAKVRAALWLRRPAESADATGSRNILCLQSSGLRPRRKAAGRASRDSLLLGRSVGGGRAVRRAAFDERSAARRMGGGRGAVQCRSNASLKVDDLEKGRAKAGDGEDDDDVDELAGHGVAEDVERGLDLGGRGKVVEHVGDDGHEFGRGAR